MVSKVVIFIQAVLIQPFSACIPTPGDGWPARRE